MEMKGLAFLLMIMIMIKEIKAGIYPCSAQGIEDALKMGGSHSLSCSLSSPTIVMTKNLFVDNSTSSISLNCNRATINFTSGALQLSQPSNLVTTITSATFLNGPAIDARGLSQVLLQDITITGEVYNTGLIGAIFVLGRDTGILNLTRVSIYNTGSSANPVQLQGLSYVTRVYCSNSAYCMSVNGGGTAYFSYCTLINVFYKFLGSAYFQNSIVYFARNVSSGPLVSYGYNIFSLEIDNMHPTDMIVQPDKYNLGPVTKVNHLYLQTPLVDSPAINSVLDANPGVDIIGNSMKRGAPDAGAVESDLYSSVYFSSTPTATEASTPYTFTVSLLYRSVASVSVTVTSSDGTAINGANRDYTTINKVVNWNNDGLAKQVTVPIGDPDYLQKPNRYFNLKLTSSNSNVPSGFTQITITDNDQACGSNAYAGTDRCYCNSGYTGKNTIGVGTCIDINECGVGGTNNCSINGICTNTPGAFSCACKPGYTGNGYTCTDINECGVGGTNNCSTNGICTNTPGAFSCACKSGYTGNGYICTDINECGVGGTNNCSTNAICTNTPGTFTCACKSGYTGNGYQCSDINECGVGGSNNCSTNGTCTNTPGAFSCACKPGYTGNGYQCSDINECGVGGTNNCSTNAICTNAPGSFSCACKSGYTGNGYQCSDINECGVGGTNNCSTNGTCTNTPGAFSCACKSGYSGNGYQCTDINECGVGGTNNCSGNATCTNTAGSFSCSCNSGYTGNGYQCADVNECGVGGSNNCSTNATCTNIPGSFTCKCKSGYNGNGYQCTDINECGVGGSNNCSSVGSSCHNTPGGYYCQCEGTYVDAKGDGTDCRDCATTVNCNGHGVCNSTGGCDCNLGFNPTYNCSRCDTSHYGYPICKYCQDSFCNGHGSCNTANGDCACIEPYTGTNCSTCVANHYIYPSCIYCGKEDTCHGNGNCNSEGLCECNFGYDVASNCSLCVIGKDLATGCTTCASDYYGFPDCKYCNANTDCSSHGICNGTGLCKCDEGFASHNCSTCAPDHYSFPACTYCTDDATCHGHGACNGSGICKCDAGFDVSTNCTSCSQAGFVYPDCFLCETDGDCNGHGSCNNQRCSCDTGYNASTNCRTCSTDYYNYPTCSYCSAEIDCNSHGSCNKTGMCECDPKFALELNCSTCASNHFDYPSCQYCVSEETCNGNGNCNDSGLCECFPGYDLSLGCSVCAPYYHGPNCSLLCNAENDCNSNGICTTAGSCQCNNGWGEDDCSIRLLLPSSCNISASLVARLGGNWTSDNSSYQLYDIIVTNLGNESISSVYLYLGNSDAFSQYWNLDSSQRNDSFINSEEIQVTGYNLINFYKILPSNSWAGAGLVAVDKIPFIFQIGCPLNSSSVIETASCDGLFVSSELINGSTYIEDGEPHSQYRVTITNIGNSIISNIFLNITTTSGSYINNIYNLGVVGENSSIYEYSLFGNDFTSGMSYNSSGFTLVNGGAVSVTCSSLKITLKDDEKTDDSNNNKGSSRKTGAIVGGVIGGAVGIALIGLIAYFIHRAKAKPAKSPSTEMFTVTGAQNRGRFGFSDLGTGYSMRNLQN